MKKPTTEFNAVADSGERHKFKTGAVRDLQAGKGFFHLISPVALRRLAKHYENGARKYSKRNWEKGMPLSCFLDSIFRHLLSILEGDHSEDHEAALAWNAFGFLHITEEIRHGRLPAELDDVGWVDQANKKYV